MHDVDLVVFDLDGTLADSRADLAAAVNHARAELGLPAHDLDTVTSFVGDGVEALLARAFHGSAPSELDRARQAFSAWYEEHSAALTRLFPGVPEMLDALRDRRLAVVTNKAERFVPPLLERLGIADRFDVIVGERPGLARKPAPDMVLHVLDTLGVTADRAVMVGDGVQDLGAGRAAGLRVVRVTWGYGRADDVLEVPPDLQVDRPADLVRAFGAD